MATNTCNVVLCDLGTVIGSYFVNMFPHRVGRVLIDGVVVSEQLAMKQVKHYLTLLHRNLNPG